jgi:hypothetical protein
LRHQVVKKKYSSTVWTSSGHQLSYWCTYFLTILSASGRSCEGITSQSQIYCVERPYPTSFLLFWPHMYICFCILRPSFLCSFFCLQFHQCRCLHYSKLKSSCRTCTELELNLMFHVILFGLLDPLKRKHYVLSG